MAEPYGGQARSRVVDHLGEWDQYNRDLPCPEWDQLYAASIDGSDPEESRARIWAHLHECDHRRLDQPCEEWDRLYAASDSEETNVSQRCVWLVENAKRNRAGALPLDQVAHSRDAHQSAPPAVQVVTYRTANDYEPDAQRRVAGGWTIQGQSQETGQTHRIRRATRGAQIGGLFMMPAAGAAVMTEHGCD